MKQVLSLQNSAFSAGLTVQRQTEALKKTNDITQEYGLVLSDEEIRAILVTRAESLRDSARIEFGEGIAAKLVLAFADSPYLSQSDYADTIASLLVLFDTFKNELRDTYNDRELLAFMRNSFDGECAGSLEVLETEVFPRLLTQDTSSGYRTAEDARFAENDTAVVSAVEKTREQLRRQLQREDQAEDGVVYDTVPEVWEDENGRQV
ncbi:MAG: hypothetical protein IKZ09_12100 [Clostridia bacterium]|nr:hypothetical protein [Clostridia bacterium]